MDLSTGVVITAYNQRHFLDQTIESVLGQTKKAAQIIVIDDGSSDSSDLLVRQYREVQYVWQENSGVAQARNHGLCKLSTDCVIFLDGDDLLLPNAVEDGSRNLLMHPECAMTSGWYDIVDQNLCRMPDPARFTGAVDYYAELLRGCYIGIPASAMFRRAALVQLGGFSTVVDPFVEDYELYLRVASHFPVNYFPKRVALCRRHSENNSGNAKHMLRGTLSVLRSQHDRASKSSVHLSAYKDGIRAAVRYWGPEVLSQALHSGGSRKLLERISAFYLVLRENPTFFATFFVNTLRERMFCAAQQSNANGSL